MPASNSSKLKLLTLMQLLYDKTDDFHGLSMAKITEELAVRGIDAERKGLYRDIEALREHGMRIAKRRQDGEVVYAVEGRAFSLEEMIWLVDAVQSCPSLTEEITDALIERVKALASESQRKMLARRVDVPGRVKMRNESVLDNLDMLQQCLRKGKEALFRYFQIGPDGKREYRYEGGAYRVTPVRIVYSGTFYYLVAWNDNWEDFQTFRVDRMEDVAVGDGDATRNRRIAEYDPGQMEPIEFGMYGLGLVPVTLLLDADVVSMAYDKFGADATYYPTADGKCRVHAKVKAEAPFFGWAATFGNRMVIEKPKGVVDAYKQHLRECAERYGE